MNRFGLRSKLTTALLSLALVPLIVATSVLVPLNLKRLENSAREYRLAVSESAIQRIRSTLSEAQTELQTIGALLLHSGFQAQQYQRMIKAAISSAKFVHIAGIYNKHGALAEAYKAQTISSPFPPPKTLPPASLRHLQEIQQANQTKTPNLIHYLPLRWTKQNQLHLPFIVPILLPSRKTFGYLWTSISLEELHKEVANLSFLRFEKQYDRIFVISQSMNILLHHHKDKRRQKAHPSIIKAQIDLTKPLGHVFEYTAQTRPFLVTIEPIPELAWGIVVQQSQAKAYAIVRSTWQTALATGLSFAILALLLGLLMGKRLSAPILAVSKAAKQVAAGDFSSRVQVPSRDEVGEMAQSFNQMASDLQTYEIQVIEETRIRTDLSRYLSSELVDEIVSHKTELALGGQRRNITVLFADIVSFTPLTEAHPPERIVAILNELFTFLTEIIFKHGGIIDKFMGDCVMATFGTHNPHEDDPLRAVRAAEEMLRWLEIGNKRWQQELQAPLQMGIGIHTGEAIVGNIGSEKRMEFTAIGEIVNIAARLETLARPGQILMAKDVADQIEDEFDVESLGSFEVTGKNKHLELFALLD